LSPSTRPTCARLAAWGGTCVLALLAGCDPGGGAAQLAAQLAQPGAVPSEADLAGVHVPPPPLSEGIFPCTDCHDPEIPVNTQRREMRTAHTEIRFEHDAEHRWCLDCHDAANRDQLHLASGAPVAFEESYRLCGQCHGDKYRDWRAGVHGRRTGRWDGEKSYLLCVHCHDSHSPRFKPLEPMPAPIPPRRSP